MKFWSLSFKPDHRPLFFLSYIRHTWISLVICQLGSTENNPTEAPQIRCVEMCSPEKSDQSKCLEYVVKYVLRLLGLPVRPLQAEHFHLVVPWGSDCESCFPVTEERKSINQSITPHQWKASKLLGTVWCTYLLWSQGSLPCGRGTRTPCSQNEHPRGAGLRLNSRWTPQKKTPPTAGARCQPGGTTDAIILTRGCISGWEVHLLSPRTCDWFLLSFLSVRWKDKKLRTDKSCVHYYTP